MEAYNRLLATLRRLLAPGGCAWDAEQSVHSMARYVVEEAWEFYDAQGLPDKAERRREMVEELGDLLYLTTFIGLLAERDGVFTLQESLDFATAKMRRRHPHVFNPDGPKLKNATAVIENWEQIKHGEADESDELHHLPLTRALGKIPRGLPPLLRSLRAQEKAARFNFDWPDVGGVIGKIDEELTELRGAVESEDKAAIEDELGDLLFSVVNLARYLNLDPGRALNGTLAKFRRRLRQVEEGIAEENRNFSDCELKELEERWQRAKEPSDNPIND